MELIDRFKGFYRHFDRTDLSRITDIYADEVVFRDPAHHLKGVADLHAYMASLGADLARCRFDYLEQVVGEDSAFIKWDMHFSHKRLRDEVISVRGITHIQFKDKIYYHEDSFDMGAMLYDNLPVMGLVTGWLKKRLAQA